MKYIVQILFLSSFLWSASSDSLDVIINEVSTENGYVELYFNESQDITGWTLKMNMRSGGGGNTVGECGSLSGSYSAGTFYVITNDNSLDTNGAPFSTCNQVDFHQNQNEAILFDANGDVVHYVSIWNGGSGDSGKEWSSTDANLSTIMDDSISGKYDNVCSLPDGDETISEWNVDDGCTGTPGVSNSGLDFTCANPAAVSQVFSENTNGGIKLIGNTIVCEGASCDEPGATTRNNSIDMTLLDIDGDGSTSSSSSANLNLNAYSEILWAKLYWQGMFYQEDSSTKASARFIKLKVPDSSEYHGIATTKSGFNWVYYGGGSSGAGDRFYFQGQQDITDLVKQGGSGTYTVADLKTQTGRPPGGSFGGWAIAVAYKNPDETFKNLTIFDGFTAVVSGGDVNGARDYANDNSCGSSSSDIGIESTLKETVSGFLTPSSGTINSKLFVFAGEGDVRNDGDSMSLTNKSGTATDISDGENPSNDIMNSKITDLGSKVTTRNPAYTNNAGIDIMSFDVSSIIEHSQTSTEITLTTSGDGYQPAVFAFSTELYTPDLCYQERMYIDSDYTQLYDGTSGMDIGSIMYIDVNVTNSGNEVAKKVRIENDYDSKFAYVTGSSKIQNVGEASFSAKTDATGDDTFDYLSGANKTVYRLGTGANTTEGGNFDFEDTVGFKYAVKILGFPDNGVFRNEHRSSYQSDALNESVGGYILPRCNSGAEGDFNVTIKINKPSGLVRIIDEDVAINNKWDGNFSTKLAGEPFNVKFQASSNLDTYEHRDENITEIKLVDEDGVEKADAMDYFKKADGSSFASPIEVTESVEAIVTIPYAYEKVRFKIKDEDDAVSFGDYFSVKPTGLVIGKNTFVDPSTAEKNYAISVKSVSGGYNQESGDLSIATIYKVSGMAGSFNLVDFQFDGVNTVPVDGNFTNVGRVDVNITDSQWTSYDRAQGDCIEDSESNEPVAGKYGCNFSASIGEYINFIPAGFRVYDISLSTESGNNYSLMGDPDDNGTINFSVDALGEQKFQTMTNFDRILDAESTQGAEISLSAIDSNITINQGNRVVEKSEFENGTASGSAGFNIERSSTTPREPLTISFADLAFDLYLQGDTDRNTTNLGTTNDEITFLYGRVKPMDASGSVSSGVAAKIYYEVYGSSGTQIENIIGSSVESKTSVNWWIISESGELTSSMFTRSDSGANPTMTPNSAEGFDSASFTSSTAGEASRVRVELDLSSKPFLYYNPYSTNNTERFYIDFTKAFGTSEDSSDLADNKSKADRSKNRLGE